MKIVEKIKEHYRKKSRWSIAGDILFYLVILLLVLPPTRKEMVSRFLRLTMLQPSGMNKTGQVQMAGEDYSWSFRSAGGQTVSLSDFRGKMIFLNFWATWCPPCVAELPSIEGLYRDYGDQVSFILVTREDPQTVRAFLEKRRLDLPFFIQHHPEPGIFRSATIPTTFLISPSGEILVKKTGAARWDGSKVRSLIDSYLTEP